MSRFAEFAAQRRAPTFTSAEGSHLRRIFEQSALARGVTFASPSTTGKIYWDAEHYGLLAVQAYRELDESTQRLLLENLNAFNLNESCLVENLGFRFNSKMMLLAETIDERSLYASFAFDEAVHLNQILPFCGEISTPEIGHQPMIQFLYDVVDETSYATTALLVQVLLEGFGLAHYAQLEKNCRNPELAAVLQGILRDEVLHHAGGKAVFLRQSLGDAERREVEDVLFRITDLFAKWPLPLLRGFTLVGRDDASFQRAFLAELQYEAKSQARLDYLRRLMAPVPTEILADIEARGAFRIPSIDETLESYRGSLINPRRNAP